MTRAPSTSELDAYVALEEHGTIAVAAASLGLAPDTVKNHLDRLRRWAGVKATIQLAPILRREMLIRPY